MIKLALRIEITKATMPAKSIKSELICVNQWLKMQETAKKYKKSYVFAPKNGPKTSTTVEDSLQIRLFLQNKPNFPHFSLENEDLTQKQSQFKPNSKPIQTQFWINIRGSKANSNPIKSNNQSSIIHNHFKDKSNVKIDKNLIVWCRIDCKNYPNNSKKGE